MSGNQSAIGTTPQGAQDFRLVLPCGPADRGKGWCVIAVGKDLSGELLAEVGNSGNSTTPHLHLNLFDQVDDLLQATVVPFVLRRFGRWDGAQWTTLENRLPDKGDVVCWCAER